VIVNTSVQIWEQKRCQSLYCTDLGLRLTKSLQFKVRAFAEISLQRDFFCIILALSVTAFAAITTH
jgi:hypothetical protein